MRIVKYSELTKMRLEAIVARRKTTIEGSEIVGEMINTKQAAAILGVSPRRVTALINNNQLKARKFGSSTRRGVWLLDKDEVIAFSKLDRPPHRPKGT